MWSEGNVGIHVGGPGQPKECSTPGAAVTFASPRGDELYESRTLVPGPISALRQPGAEGRPCLGSATAPQVGNAGSRTRGGAAWVLVIGWSAAAAGCAALVSVRQVKRRRLRRTR